MDTLPATASGSNGSEHDRHSIRHLLDARGLADQAALHLQTGLVQCHRRQARVSGS